MSISIATRIRRSSTRPIRYTPTFVLAEDGKEVGRIEGYPGDEFFWVAAGKSAGAIAALPRPGAAKTSPPAGASAVPPERAR